MKSVCIPNGWEHTFSSCWKEKKMMLKRSVSWSVHKITYRSQIQENLKCNAKWFLFFIHGLPYIPKESELGFGVLRPPPTPLLLSAALRPVPLGPLLFAGSCFQPCT